MGLKTAGFTPYSSPQSVIPNSVSFALRILVLLLLHYIQIVRRRVMDWLNAIPACVLQGWCFPRSSTARRYTTAGKQPRPLPRQLLQMIGQYMEPADLAAARLVSKEWRQLLSAQVTAVQLPPQLWQYTAPGQLVQLFRVLSVFKHLQEVKLTVVASQPVDGWAVARAMDTFRAHLPTLQSMELSGVMQSPHWRAILGSMQCLSPQLKSLRLTEICWPPVGSLHLISQMSALRQLHIRSPHFSRLETSHLAAIGQLPNLQELRLCFRTVDGTAHSPLRLDPLSSLVKLTALEVQYTGLLELASAVVFCGPAALKCFTNLTSLSVSLVPVPCLASLRHLSQLRHLELQQAQPVTGAQCVSLAECQQLHSLSLSCLQWADIPKLAPLSGLQGLSLQIYQPARGSLPGVMVGQQLLQLRALSKLRSLRFKGQCDLSSDLLTQLAGHWAELTELDLCCIMPDGTQGLQQFTALRSLKVQPYKWDVWSSEPPVLLFPGLLPSTLTSLEGLDVWCMEEPPSSSNTAGSSSNSPMLRQSSSFCSITGLLTSFSGVDCNLRSSFGGASCSGSRNDAAAALKELDEMPVSPASAAVVAVCGDWSDSSSSSSSLAVRRAVTAPGGCAASSSSSSSGGGSSSTIEVTQDSSGDQDIQPQQQTQQRKCHPGLVLRTPHLQRLVLRSTSPFDRKLHMPVLSCCSELEYLELHHSQLNQCHLQHIAESCPTTLRSLKLVAIDDTARIRASGLTILTRLSALTDLSVHAHERAINKNVRRSISTMSQLRSLTLLTSPDYPTNFARNLACLTQLTNLMVLRVGLGFGALDALRRLGSHVTKALPHCTFQMLTDGCTDPEHHLGL